MTPLHVASLVATWRQNYARNTTYYRRIALKKVLRWFEDTTGARGLSTTMPRVPGPAQRHIVATLAELTALHDTAEPLMRIWLRITTALALGQHEVQTLAPAHYDAEKKTVSFIRKKTGEPNTLPIPDDLAAIFEAAPHADDPATPFLQLYNRGLPLTRKAIEWRWRMLKERAGVRRIITPHDLRRTTATAAYDLTKDLRVIQQLLGHARPSSTLSYIAHHDPTVLRPLLAQLWKPITEVKQ